MKLSTKCISLVAMVVAPLTVGGAAQALSEEHLGFFSQNDIMFYNPEQCQDSSSSGICGNTVQEKYWTAVRERVGEVQAAGILGNIYFEGGFNPVRVGCWDDNSTVWWDSTGHWKTSYEDYTTAADDDRHNGVGSFGITSSRGEYLRHVGEVAPDLVVYFAEPWNYSFDCPWLSNNGADNSGAAFLQKVGDAVFDRLIKIEIDWAFDVMIPRKGAAFDMDKFQAMTDPHEAGAYWAIHYEVCNDCFEGLPGPGNRGDRAIEVYDEFKGYACHDSDSSEGQYSAKSFDASDDELKRLVNVAKAENPCTFSAIKHELSLMANLTESKKYESVGDYVVNGGWFSTAEKYYGSTDGVTDEEFEAARDIIRNGNRTLPKEIVEHDTFGDISWIELDGVRYTASRDISNRDLYVKGKTIIQNDMGSNYLFYTWAGEPEEKCGDPMGYFPNNPPSDMAGTSESSTSASSSASTAGSTSTATSSTGTVDAKITIIGDSVGVQSEKELMEKFPNAYFNLMGSRHATNGDPRVCNDSDRGGIETLRQLLTGSGTIVTQHAGGRCESVAIDEDSVADIVVWELGGNTNGADREHIEQVVGMVGDRKLYLVTPYDGLHLEVADNIADIYRNVASEHDNVYIVDWNKAVRDDEAKYIHPDQDGSKVHPTEEGRKLLAELIAQAIGGGGSNCMPEDFVWLDQCDPRWTNETWVTSGKDFCNNACGVTSFATIATAFLGREVTPVEVYPIAMEAGIVGATTGTHASEPGWREMAEHYGLEFEWLQDWSTAEDVDRIVTERLKDGWMIAALGGNQKLGEKGGDGLPFTKGHWVVIRGIAENGEWLLSDPAHNRGKKNTFERTWTAAAIKDDGLLYLYALRGSGAASGSAEDCSDVCETDTTEKKGIGAGGVKTAEEAQWLIDEFMKDDLHGLELLPNTDKAAGDKHANCTAFSTWFVNRFTDIPLNAGYHGKDVVDKIYELYKGQFPDLQIDYEPSVYSVGSWGQPPTLGGSSDPHGHTGIIVGIDKAANKIIIAESSWNNPEWMGVHEYKLSDATGSPTWKYINLNKHITDSRLK